MSEWKKVKLKDICSKIIDCVNKTAPVCDYETPYKMLRTSDIRNGQINTEGLKCVTKETFEKWNRRGYLQKGDVIFTREAPVGEVGWLKDPKNLFLGQRLMFFRTDNNKCDNRFLFYSLSFSDNKRNIIAMSNGSTVNHLRVPDCENIEISIPDLPIQHRIATILSRYDSLIENYQKQIKLLEEAAQRLYKEWFVDLHFPGHETTKIVDGVPEGWEKKKIGDFVTFYDKQRKPLSSMQRMNMEKIYPYYGAASLMDYVDNYLFDGIYLLFGEDGTVITPDNHPVLQYVWGKFWVNNHAHVLRGKDRISTEFLYVLFRNITISDVVTGVAQPKISQGRLSEKMAMLPPITLIEKWSSIAGTYFFQLRNLSSQIRFLTEVRNRLLPKLMNGEIAV